MGSIREGVMEDNLRGILCVVLAMFLLSMQDLLLKILSSEGSILQTVVVRSFVGGVLIVIFLKARGQKVAFGSPYPIRTILRGLLFTVGFMTFYLSLSLLPLAEATALFFVSPFFVTLFSAWFFKAKIGLHRIGAIVTGFMGMLLIVKPDPALFNWASLLPIFCAFTYALSMLLAKQTSDKESSYQQVKHMYMAGIVCGGLMTLAISGRSWAFLAHPDLAFLVRPWRFDDPMIWGLTLVVAVLSSVGIVLLVTAYRLSEPSVIAPFEYTGLLMAPVLGYAYFREIPDLWLLFGILLIVGSGMYIFFRESVRKKPMAIETRLR